MKKRFNLLIFLINFNFISIDCENNIMVKLDFYRYISHPVEIRQVLDERTVRTTKPYAQKTYFTTLREDNPTIIQRKLSLPDIPIFRVGPFSTSELPDLIVHFRIAVPAHGHAGGGIEVAIRGRIHIFGVYDMNHNTYRF